MYELRPVQLVVLLASYRYALNGWPESGFAWPSSAPSMREQRMMGTALNSLACGVLMELSWVWKNANGAGKLEDQGKNAFAQSCLRWKVLRNHQPMSRTPVVSIFHPQTSIQGKTVALAFSCILMATYISYTKWEWKSFFLSWHAWHFQVAERSRSWQPVPQVSPHRPPAWTSEGPGSNQRAALWTRNPHQHP